MSWGLPGDISCFNMEHSPTNLAGVRAVRELVRSRCRCIVTDSTEFWTSLRPFCVTRKDSLEIDWWHHGDPSWNAVGYDRISWYWDRHLQRRIFLTKPNCCFADLRLLGCLFGVHNALSRLHNLLF